MQIEATKMIRNTLYIGLGTLSLGCGIVGIVVPGLPTTPFLLLAAWFYVRSSSRLHDKLVNHKYLGRYITGYSEGVSRKVKYRIFAMMWGMVTLSTVLFMSDWRLRAVVIAAAAIGTYVVWRIKEPQDKNE